MKKLLAIICCIALGFLLIGCGYNKPSADIVRNDGRMTLIYNDGFVVIYRDNITGVQYFSRANAGSCVMVDADGNPLVLTGGE